MKVLLTGASGFVGSFALKRLLADNRTEIAVALRQPDRAWRIRDELKRVRVFEMSLDDEPRVLAAIGEFRPTHLVHLAWAGVLGGMRNDASQHVNVFTTMRMLEHAIESGVQHFVGLGSQAEYGPCEGRIDETTATSPTTMYGASKLATSILASRLCELAGIRFSWLRLFSSYGPQDNPEWMIPYLILKLLRRERPAVTAAGQIWDYINVEDAAAAVVQVTYASEARGVFNLGSGSGVPLRDVIEVIRDQVDPALSVGFGEVQYRPDQVMHLEADIRKLTAAAEWKPEVDLHEGIRRTVEWYKANESRY